LKGSFGIASFKPGKSEFLASYVARTQNALNRSSDFRGLRERYFGDLKRKASEYIVDIVDSGKHLLSLINDILDLSKVEAGEMELDLSEVKIANLLQIVWS